MNVLCDQLLYSNDNIKEKKQSSTLPIEILHSVHEQPREKSQGRYEWGRLHPPGCVRKRNPKKRKFGIDITTRVNNGISGTILGGSVTHSKCSKCQIFLCIEGECWQQYHGSVGVDIAR